MHLEGKLTTIRHHLSLVRSKNQPLGIENVMLAGGPTSIVLKRATQLLTMFAFTVLVTTNGNAADLRLQLKDAPQPARPPSAKPSEQLLKEFLTWKKKQQS